MNLALAALLAWSPMAFANDTSPVITDAAIPDTTPEDTTVANQPDPDPVKPPENHIPEGLWSLGSGSFYSPYSIIADKARRTLSLWKSESDGSLSLVKYYPMDMGRKEGDKVKLGDLKTPEGIYFFQETYSGSQLNFDNYGNRAFTMDYPNYFDRRAKKTGSGIWLHAIPPEKTLKRGSRGCVVVRNAAIDELLEYIDLKKTSILVFNEVKYLPKAEYLQKRIEVMKWLEQWRSDWQSGDLDKYMNHYAENFYALKMTKPAWRKYKDALYKKYDFISVALEEPIVFQHNDELIVRFLQDYTSDSFSDYGEKTLYLRQKENGYKIMHEKWQTVPQEFLAARKSRLEAATKKAN